MMPLNKASPAFAQRYASHLKHLKLQGLQAKTVDAYACAIRTLGDRTPQIAVPVLRRGDGDCAPAHRARGNAG